MTNERLTELLKIAYRWGRDNGLNRSEKNFNDLLQTKAISEALRIHDVVGSCHCSRCGDKHHDCLNGKMCYVCDNVTQGN